jgi:hypothetical protein
MERWKISNFDEAAKHSWLAQKLAQNWGNVFQNLLLLPVTFRLHGVDPTEMGKYFYQRLEQEQS